MRDDVLISVLEDLCDNLAFSADTSRIISSSCMRVNDIEGEYYYHGIASGLDAASRRLATLLDSVTSGHRATSYVPARQ